MAYVAPTTRAAGFFVTAPVWNQDVVDNVTFLANPPACRVYHDTTQSLANDTNVVLSMNQERYDTAGMHSTSVNNSRIIAAIPGLYLITGHVAVATGSDYIYVQVAIRLNGATYIASDMSYPEVGGNTVALQKSISTVYKLAANDYVELVAAQRNTAPASRSTVVTAALSPEVSATWVGLG